MAQQLHSDRDTEAIQVQAPSSCTRSLFGIDSQQKMHQPLIINHVAGFESGMRWANGQLIRNMLEEATGYPHFQRGALGIAVETAAALRGCDIDVATSS
jgi:hypothetical protein